MIDRYLQYISDLVLPGSLRDLRAHGQRDLARLPAPAVAAMPRRSLELQAPNNARIFGSFEWRSARQGL